MATTGNKINTKTKQIISMGIASIPLISLIGIEVYVSGFDGWGAWAAAPLFPIPMALSVVLGIIFMVDLFRSYRLMNQ